MQDIIDKASVLIEALPYIQEFRDDIVVIKFGGSAMEDSNLTASTMRDIVFLECIGMKPVVVHGGGKAISARLKELNIPSHFVNGLRFTCDDTIGVVDSVLHNDVNSNLIEGISQAGGKGHQVSGKRFMKAEKMFTECKETGDQLDIGHVGSINSVDTQLIIDTVNNNIVPVIPPLAVDENNQTYNINADIAACKIAEALKARKLVFLSDVPGIMKDPSDESSVISTVTIDGISDLIEQGVISGGMIPKVKSAISALNAGTNKVHMIDGRLKHSLLLEIFTDSGVGTEITN